MTFRIDDGWTPTKPTTTRTPTTKKSSGGGSTTPKTFTPSAGAVDPKLIYAYLVQHHGVSWATAAGILANIQAESGFRPDVFGDNNTSGGLFQHHKSRFTDLLNFAAQRGTHWTDWRTQVDFAMQEARDLGLNLQHTDAAAAAREWSLKFERPAGGQASANARAKLVGQYMYGDPANLNLPVEMTSNQPMRIPDGGFYYKVGGEYYVAFRVYGNHEQKGPFSVVYYKVTGQPPSGARSHTPAEWQQITASWVNGGTTDVFRGSNYRTYMEMVENLLRSWGLWGSDALQDKGILDIVAIGLTRELSDAELANRIRQTEWYNSKTDKEREWNDLSDAEKEARIVEEAMKMSQLWFTYVGQDLRMGDLDQNGDGVVSASELRKGNKDLYTWAERIASGKSTQVEAVNVWMKDVALQDPESPWSRSVRQEEQARGQFGVDVSNMAGQIWDMYHEWGVPIADANLQRLAEDVVMNRLSIEDVEQSLREMAQGLYPHKPENLSTRQWATPYINLYMQTLETGEPGLDDALLQRGLSEGMNLADFRQMLRRDERWLNTVNARDEMHQKISELGRVMGF